MRHALMYVGGFERNFANLNASSTSFDGTDGRPHDYQSWPASADGLRVSYMEKHGKKFVAVRIADSSSDAVLKNELVLVPGQHFGFGTRLSGEPTLVEDDGAMLKLVEDAMKRNVEAPEVTAELMKIRARLKEHIAKTARPARGPKP